MKRLLLLCVAMLPIACSSPTPTRASAVKISSREQLVGGRRALGEVGDFRISNGIIQAVIQDVGHSRGFGAFGGSLIDIDLVRAGVESKGTGVTGNDQFTELFPAFFLEAMEPTKVEVARDGTDGGPAVIRVTGDGSQFLSIAKGFNQIVLGDAKLSYQVDYILEPGKQYVKAEVTVFNHGDGDAQFGVDVPTGFISLLGAGQKLFVPGKAGYDMRFRLDEVYKNPVGLNALPGEVASMVVTEGKGTSYAFAADQQGASYLQNKPEYYPTAERDSLLIPMAYSSFLGTYWGRLPQTLAKGKSYSFAAYLAVGGEDVASAQKVIYDLKQKKVARVSGRVREQGTQQLLQGVAVVLQDDKGNYLSSAHTREDGSYLAWVPPGKYRAIAVAEARSPAFSANDVKDYVEISEDGANIDLTVERSAILSVVAVDEKGRPLPAKVSVEGISEMPKEEGSPPWTFLYNLRVGENRRATDFDPDQADDPKTRRYLETHFFINDGHGGEEVKPGKYTVYVSRGVEYDLAKQEVTLEPGKTTQVNVVLHHVLDTPGWASGDFHVHSEHSVDSDYSLDQRVLSYAAEGVDYIASTDHNYITDFRPIVEGLGLQDWLATSVGIELTTLEMGHFNAYPIKFDPGPVNHGSFNWFRRKPGDLFANLRAIGAAGPEHPEKMVVQVNHPTDTIMGYFNAFNWDAYNARPLPPGGALALDQDPQPDETESPYLYSNFSYDFDALEVFNGKRQDLIHHYRIPEIPPPGPDPKPGTEIPPPGEILEKWVRTVPDADCSTPETSVCTKVPAFPGALDDYYSLLAHGHLLTAVGNSDSHEDKDEAGLPRTYLHVGKSADSTMRAFDESAAIAAMKHQQVVVTNGPFVELTVNDQPVGSHVVAPDRHVTLHVKVQAAPWVDVSRVVVLRGGKDRQKDPEVVKTFAVDPSEDLIRLEQSLEVNDVPDSSFFVVEVYGEKSLWPVYTPYEIPSIQISEAVSAIGGAFGFGDTYGRYKPQQTQAVKPFAFTNPVFVDRTLKQSLVAAKQLVKPLGAEPGEHVRRRIPDLAKMLSAFHGE